MGSSFGVGLLQNQSEKNMQNPMSLTLY